MTALTRWLKSADKFARPLNDHGTSSVFGGITSISTYVLLLAYLGYYINQTNSRDFPTSVSIRTFPQRNDEPEYLPEMSCIANSGCWYLPYNVGPSSQGRRQTEGTGGDTVVRHCYYLREGESVPEEHRAIIHDSDPVDSFSALWETQNFGFSYQVDTVTAVGTTLTYESMKPFKSMDEASTSEGERRFMIYKGASLFNLVKTQGLGGDDDVVNSWTNTVTSEDGTADKEQNLCCGADTVINPKTGETLSDAQYLLKTRNACSEGWSGRRRRSLGEHQRRLGEKADGEVCSDGTECQSNFCDMGGNPKVCAAQPDPSPGGGGDPPPGDGGDGGDPPPGDGGDGGDPPPGGGGGAGGESLNQLKIRPFPTYNLITVENPLEPLALWAVLGGALAVIDLLASGFVHNIGARLAGKGKENNNLDGIELQSVTPTANAQQVGRKNDGDHAL